MSIIAITDKLIESQSKAAFAVTDSQAGVFLHEDEVRELLKYIIHLENKLKDGKRS